MYSAAASRTAGTSSLRRLLQRAWTSWGLACKKQQVRCTGGAVATLLCERISVGTRSRGLATTGRKSAAEEDSGRGALLIRFPYRLSLVSFKVSSYAFLPPFPAG